MDRQQRLVERYTVIFIATMSVLWTCPQRQCSGSPDSLPVQGPLTGVATARTSHQPLLPAVSRRLDQEAHDLEQHRHRPLGPRSSRLWLALEQV